MSEGLDHPDVVSVYQKGTRLLTITDLSPLYGTILEFFLAETDGEGGVLWAGEGEDSGKLVQRCSRGKIAVEKFPMRIVLSQHPLAASFAHGVPFAAGVSGEGKDLYIPLVHEGRTLGVALITRRTREFRGRDIGITGMMADFACLALTNAFRVHRVSQGAMREHMGGVIYTPQYFMEYASKMILQARRYQKVFSLLILTIENYGTLAGHFTASLLKSFTDRMMNAVGEAMRGSDLAARYGESALLILLPETDSFGSLLAGRRIRRMLKGKKYIADQTSHMPVAIALGSASFPRDGEDIAGLIGVATRRAQEQKNSLIARLNLEGRDFWSSVSTLLEADRYVIGSPGSRSAQVGISTTTLESVRNEFLREVSRERERRGLLCLGGNGIAAGPLPGDIRSQLVILGSGAEGAGPDSGWSHPSATRIRVTDGSLESNHFVLFLNEDYAYGLLCRRGKGSLLQGFHTDDPVVVDSLIAKLHDRYLFQKETG